jgi:PST family polysaccharide transporter
VRNADSRPCPSALEAAVEGYDGRNHVNSPWVNLLPQVLRDRMSGRHNLQAALGNSGWLFADKVFRLGVGLFIGVWVARYLGPGRFGLLNYSIAFTSLFSALATLGLDGVVVRELVKSPDQKNVLLGSAFALKLIGAMITFIFVLGAVSIVRPGDTLTFWLVVLSAAGFIFQSLNVIDLYFQSKVQSRYTVYAANSAFILITLVKVALLLLAAPLIAFAWAGLGEIALTAFFLLAAYRINHLNMWEWRWRLWTMRDLLLDSWPLILTGLSIMIAMRIDQIMIGQMLTDKAVGLYSAAAKISELWYFVPLAIAGSAFPALIESKRYSEELYYRRLQKLYNILVLLAVAVAVTMTFLAGPIVKLLFGRAYADSAGPLRILIWGGITVSFGCAWSNWMLLENRTRMMFFFQLATALTNVLLNLVLIPRYGIMGSAYATLISYWFGSVGLFAIIKSQHKALAMIAKALFPYWVFYRPDAKSTPL